MSSHWIKGPICGIENCRSRHYEEEADGYQYCQNGHRRGNVLATERDGDDDFNPYVKWQTAKSGDDEVEQKQYKFYRGREAFTLYLQCYQLILRHQIWYLIHNKGLPPELENVIFDLWALRVMTLKDRVVDVFSGDDSQSQMFSSGSEEETEEEVSSADDTRAKIIMKKVKKSSDTPQLIETLGLCYLGVLTLRLPVTTGDIYDWTTDGDLIYAKAKDCLPQMMREKLPPYFLSSLEPSTVLKHSRLHWAILDLIISYGHHHGIKFPPLNYPLLLFRHLKELALPLEIYAAAANLARILDYTFAYPLDRVQRPLQYTDIPDVQVIALIVIGVKLFYPFDSIERHPIRDGEPASARIDWAAWKDSMSTFKKSLEVPGQFKNIELMVLQEKDMFSLNSGQIDQYLDWYQRTWVDERVGEQDEKSDFHRELFKQFPIDPPSRSSYDSIPPSDDATIQAALMTRMQEVHGAMGVNKVVPEGSAMTDTKRPGSMYKHYRREHDLPEWARAFYEEAARVSGLSIKMLVRAVFSMERRIQELGAAQRRQERMQTEQSM